MHNKKIITIVSLCVSLFLITAGYAIYSSNLKITGTGSIDSNFNIEVTNIKEESKKGKAVSVTEPTYTNSTATFNTKLQRAGDNIEYLVEITNSGTIDGKINTITITNPSNIVKVEVRGIIEGEIIKSGEVKTYIVRVYIEDGTKIEEDITSVIEVNSEIIQDDNQIFNAGTDGVVENKLEIESTKEESDYTSIKANIIAKGNGLKYYYSLDGETWSEASLSNTYTFTGLEVSTRYTVYYKVEDENLNYVLDSKWINTKDIDSPVITVKNEKEWTTTKEVVIEYPEIEGASYYYKVEEISEISLLSEEWISTTEKKITINLNNNSVISTKIELNGTAIEVSKKITKIDNFAPELSLSTSKTTNSITVVANASSLSGIKQYEFSIDGGETWLDNGKYNLYTFSKLIHDSTYAINVRVTKSVGASSEATITETTAIIEVPSFEEKGTLNKTVTITYPEGCGNIYTCSYIKNSEEEVSVTTETAEIKFIDEGTLIAKVNDGTNYITSSTYTVTKPSASELEGVFIYDIESLEDIDSTSVINSYEETTLNSDIILSENNVNSLASYTITIYNNTEKTYFFNGIEYVDGENINDNENITVLLENLEYNDVLLAGDNITFTVTFSYLTEKITDNSVNSILNFLFLPDDVKETLSGIEFNYLVKSGENAPEGTVEEYYNTDANRLQNYTVKKIVFGKTSDYTTVVAGLEKEPIDFYRTGSISLYRKEDSNGMFTIYILSDSGDFVLNENSSWMFDKLYELEEIVNLHLLDTSNVVKMRDMFCDCAKLKTVDLSNFDTSNVTNMIGMFARMYAIQYLDLSSFDTSNVSLINQMFSDDSALKKIYISNKWKLTDKVEEGTNVFKGCTVLTGGNGTALGTDLSYIMAVADTPSTPGYLTNGFSLGDGLDFNHKIKELTQTQIDAWSTSNRYTNTNIETITFGKSRDYQNVIDDYTPISVDGDSSGVVSAYKVPNSNGLYDMYILSNSGTFKLSGDASWTFDKLIFLKRINNLNLIDTASVTAMRDFFCDCQYLEEVDLSNFNTSKVTTFEGMFARMYALETLDLSTFSTSSLTTIKNMFSLSISATDTHESLLNCTPVLKTVYVSNSWNISNVTSTDSVFANTINLVGGNGTIFNSTNNTATYAVIDTASTPGYFTLK